MPKRPGKTKKRAEAPKSGKPATPNANPHTALEKQKDWNVRNILDQFQGRKSVARG